LDLDLLLSLVNEQLWTPDFLNPRPASPLTRIDQEIAALRRLPGDRFMRHLADVHERLPRRLAGDPAEVQRRVVVELERYWTACIAPHWPRMRTILEADIAFRGRQVAQLGFSAMLNSLSPRLSFEHGALDLRLKCVRDSVV